MMSFINMTINDGESLRKDITTFLETIRRNELGDLIRVKDAILFIMLKYERPTIIEDITGVTSNNPDYQSVRPLLIKALESVYEELNRRGSYLPDY